jgi:chromate reductase, NAD(P)H dehydrogenase (quinone)
MSTTFDVVAVVGSLRRGSYTCRLVRSLAKLAPPSMRIEIVEIGALQAYTEDLDTTPTEEWAAFRERIARADAVLFATPEYNRSAPGVLKNAIDVGSRPYGKSVWAGKPAAIISVSPGALGALGANHHLRQSLMFLDMPTLQQPAAYIGGIATLLDEEGRITDESRRKFFVDFLGAFESLIREC